MPVDLMSVGTTSAAVHVRVQGAARERERKSESESEPETEFVGSVVAATIASGMTLVSAEGSTEAGRALTFRPGGEWVTITTRADGFPDLAALADLGARITQVTGSVAMLTSVIDSDSFQLVVFEQGRQVDMIGSDDADDQSRLAVLTATERAQWWQAHFPLASPEAQARAAASDSAFAEDRLGAWCALAGLDQARLVATHDEAGGVPGARTWVVVDDRATAGPGGPEPDLAVYRSDDDCPHLRVYPAAWPVEPGSPTGFSWLVVSRGPGFDGLVCTIAADGAVEIGELSFTANSFYNGQVTSMTPLASCQLRMEGGRPQTVRVEPFRVPDVRPESRSQVVLIVRVEATVTGDDATTVHLSLRPNGSAGSLELPPLRLRPRRRSWTPLRSRVVDPGISARAVDDAVLGLNEPAIRSFVAIHRVGDQSFYDRLRDHCERWLGEVPLDSATATVHTQRHMTAAANVSKSTRSVPVGSLTPDKRWARLFRSADPYQTVRLTIEPLGRYWPVGGITLQESLRVDPAMTVSYGEALDALLGSGEIPVETEAITEPTLTVMMWSVDHPEVDSLLGTSGTAVEEAATRWCEAEGPIQAWMSSVRWIPELDRAEEWNETLYEQAVAVDWFRSNARGALGSVAWTTRRLRFVSSRMWLGPDLASRVDPDALGRVAVVHRSASTTGIVLRPDRGLDELEQVLAPILPGG